MWQLSSGYQTKCFGKLCKIYRKRSGIRIPAECSDSISHPPHPSQLLAGVPPSCRSHCRQSQCSLSAAPGPAPCCRLLARRGTHHTRASSASGTPADTVCRTCAGTRTQWGEQPGGPRAFPVWYGAAFPCAAPSGGPGPRAGRGAAARAEPRPLRRRPLIGARSTRLGRRFGSWERRPAPSGGALNQLASLSSHASISPADPAWPPKESPKCSLR